MRYDDTFDIAEDGTITNVITGKIRNPVMRGQDKNIVLHRKGHPTYYAGLLHRLIAKLWIPNPLNKPQVDHIDRNKMNNTVANLRWVTASENQLNRRPDTIPRSHNTSGHLQIVVVLREKGDGYRVQLGKFRHYSTHDTLEEAIVMRDRVISEAGV